MRKYFLIFLMVLVILIVGCYPRSGGQRTPESVLNEVCIAVVLNESIEGQLSENIGDFPPTEPGTTPACKEAGDAFEIPIPVYTCIGCCDEPIEASDGSSCCRQNTCEPDPRIEVSLVNNENIGSIKWSPQANVVFISDGISSSGRLVSVYRIGETNVYEFNYFGDAYEFEAAPGSCSNIQLRESQRCYKVDLGSENGFAQLERGTLKLNCDTGDLMTGVYFDNMILNEGKLSINCCKPLVTISSNGEILFDSIAEGTDLTIRE